MGFQCDGYIGAIDQGTTSTRFVIFDHSGDIVASHQKEHKQIYPRPGWCEHDPKEILENIEYVIQEGLKKANIEKESIKAIGVTNQRETSILWDKSTGIPCHNAIVWNDTRTAEIVHRLEAGEGSFPGKGKNRFRHVTGLPIASYFSATKIIWMLENVPHLREKCENGQVLFGTMDTWILWNLTGGVQGGIHVTDVTNASRTNFMRLDDQTWDESILSSMNIPKTILPQIKSSSEIYGYVHTSHILSGVPLAGNLGDQSAALFGQTCFASGDAKNTYGTGCFFLMNTGSKIVESSSGLLTTVAYKIGNEPTAYALEGSVAVAGSLIQWLRDNLKIIDTANQVEDLAREVQDNGGVYFVPAFSGLFTPHWRDDARGVIVGLTSYCTQNHIARAALEATAFQTREVADAMMQDSHVPLKRLSVDGGMVENETLMQFQADILNVPVVRPKIMETTSLGAAYAAGLAIGFWKNINELSSKWQVCHKWKPSMDENQVQQTYRKWKKAVTKTLNWVDEPGE